MCLQSNKLLAIFLMGVHIAVDSTKEMLGTFSPQAEAYTHQMPEETTPSGIFARGSYSARTKVVHCLTIMSSLCIIFS